MMTTRHALHFAFALLGAVLLGLAAGAVWMVAALALRQSAPWLALPAGMLLALGIRHWIYRPGMGAAGLAASATVLAALYFNALMASIRLAANFGMNLVEAMRTAGAGMLLALAQLGLRPLDWAWYLAGATLAAWLAGRGDGRRSS